jgi:hypothetical protein
MDAKILHINVLFSTTSNTNLKSEKRPKPKGVVII